MAMEALQRSGGDFADKSAWRRRFTFDYVFDSSTDPASGQRHDDQNDVFEALGTRVGAAAWHGIDEETIFESFAPPTGP